MIPIPAQCVRSHVRRSETDAANGLAMIEAARGIGLRLVPMKTEPQRRCSCCSVWSARL